MRRGQFYAIVDFVVFQRIQEILQEILRSTIAACSQQHRSF